MATTIYRNLNLSLVRNVNALLDVSTLLRVIPHGTIIPNTLNTATNCCWVNVWITTLASMGVRISATDTDELIRNITAAGSRVMSPLDIGDLTTRVNLPVTLIEYSSRDRVGWGINTPNGPIVAFVNTGVHYQIWMPVDSDLAKRFTLSVVPDNTWSTITNVKPRSIFALRQAKYKNMTKDTADARKHKDVSTTTITIESNVTSDDGSIALRIAYEDIVINESIDAETRRLVKISLDLSDQMDSDSRMARELSDQINGR